MMIEIYRLTKRHIDSGCKLPKELEQIKVFSLCTGHGIGTIDFVECVMKIDDEVYENILKSSGEYAKFKLGNLFKYFEIEVFPEHIKKLKDELPDSSLKKLFLSLKEGYLVIKKI